MKKCWSVIKQKRIKMLKIPNKTIEKIFGRKVVKNIRCIGVDTASRSGWARIETNGTHICIDYGFVDVATNDTYYKYNQCISIFNNLIKDVDKVVIEETWYGRNVKTFQLLSRLGGFVYTIAHLKGIKEKVFISAVSARARLGFSSRAKKAIVHREFHTALEGIIDIKDEDIVDAIVLALCGILKEGTIKALDV